MLNRSGSVEVDFTIVYGTMDSTVASELTEAVFDLQQGSLLIFEGQNVSASSGKSACCLKLLYMDSIRKEHNTVKLMLTFICEERTPANKGQLVFVPLIYMYLKVYLPVNEDHLHLKTSFLVFVDRRFK